MGVPSIGVIQSSSAVAMQGTTQTAPIAPQPKLSFTEILNGVKGRDLHAEVNQLQQHLINNKDLTPRELLLYQIKVGRIGMQVELVSKLSEAMIATSRRLQNSQ